MPRVKMRGAKGDEGLKDLHPNVVQSGAPCAPSLAPEQLARSLFGSPPITPPHLHPLHLHFLTDLSTLHPPLHPSVAPFAPFVPAFPSSPSSPFAPFTSSLHPLSPCTLCPLHPPLYPSSPLARILSPFAPLCTLQS